MAGAPLGNQNSRKGRIWADALKRALEAKTGDKRKALDDLAQVCVAKALDGDMSAIKEIGDRIDGKAIQPTSHVDDDGNSIPIAVAIQFVARGESK